MASGAALVSVYSSVAETVNKDFFGAASHGVGRMKAVGGWLGGFGTFVGVYYDFGDIKYNFDKRNYGLALLSFFKFGAGGLVGTAQFLTALAFSSPLLQRVIGRKGIVIFLDSLRSGIQAAALKEGEQALASKTMMRVGSWVLRLGGWEVALVITAIQGMIWVISPNALEVWCERNYFGKVSEGGWLGLGSSTPHYKKIIEQDEAFSTALGKVITQSRSNKG